MALSFSSSFSTTSTYRTYITADINQTSTSNKPFDNASPQLGVAEQDSAVSSYGFTEALTTANKIAKLEQAIESLVSKPTVIKQMQALLDALLTKSSRSSALINHSIKIKMGDAGYSLLKYYQLLDLKSIEQQTQLRLPPYCQLLLASDVEQGCYRSLQAIKPFNATELIVQQAIVLLSQDYQLLVALLQRMVTQAQTAVFKGLIKAEQALDQSSLTHFSEYIQRLCRHYSQLIVVQVELGYQPQSCLKDTIAQSESLVYAKDNLLSLLPLHPAFNQAIGYLWQTTYHATKGVYARLVMFVEGNTSYTTEQIAQSIGSLWQQLTDGKGYCLAYPKAITAQPTPSLPVDSLDKLYTRDTFKVKQLLNQLVPAMAKPDACLRLMTSMHRLNEGGDLACVEEFVEE